MLHAAIMMDRLGLIQKIIAYILYISTPTTEDSIEYFKNKFDNTYAYLNAN